MKGIVLSSLVFSGVYLINIYLSIHISTGMYMYREHTWIPVSRPLEDAPAETQPARGDEDETSMTS